MSEQLQIKSVLVIILSSECKVEKTQKNKISAFYILHTTL